MKLCVHTLIIIMCIWIFWYIIFTHDKQHLCIVVIWAKVLFLSIFHAFWFFMKHYIDQIFCVVTLSSSKWPVCVVKGRLTFLFEHTNFRSKNFHSIGSMVWKIIGFNFNSFWFSIKQCRHKCFWIPTSCCKYRVILMDLKKNSLL